MGKGDDKKAEGLSPEEVERLNRDQIDYQMEKLPVLQFSDIFGNANEAFGGLFGTAANTLNTMVESGQQNFANNPMKQLVSMIAGEKMGDMGGEMTTTDPIPPISQQPPPTQELSPYEKRIRQLMSDKGMSRQQAEANQAHAKKLGVDMNNNGASANEEWAMKLGADFDGDGSVTGKEWTQWQSDNPDHREAGGTKYSGLPNQHGGFGSYRPPNPQQPQGMPQGMPQQPQGMPQGGLGQLQTGGGLGMDTRVPRDMTAHEPGTMQPTQPVAGQPATNPQSPGKGSGQKAPIFGQYGTPDGMQTQPMRDPRQARVKGYAQ
jgi:hypothetical protein